MKIDFNDLWIAFRINPMTLTIRHENGGWQVSEGDKTWYYDDEERNKDHWRNEL